MNNKGYRGRQRSNTEWVAALQDDGSVRQRDAFTDLGHFLRYYLLNDVIRRSNSVPALAGLVALELEAVADDLVQLALVRIYQKIDLFVDNGDFLGFALVVARHILIDEFRRKHWTTLHLSPVTASSEEGTQLKRLPTLADIPDPLQSLTDVDAIWQEMAQIVYAAIREDLSENQAQAFIAYHFYNMSSKEIAPLMDKSPAAVDQLRRQAKLKIKERLKAHGYDESELDVQ
ncbi:MAG: sigma-70 family RNA polymerase sigma factor [Caldilineaceae bacterium]